MRHTVEEFFDAYAAAVLARDETAMAGLYRVPALIVYPGQIIMVTDRAETERYFAAVWAQYDGVTEAQATIRIMARTPVAVWADVTWSYGAGPRERFCYQLTGGEDPYRIVVLTPLEGPAASGQDIPKVT
jgi:hypothetical protein